VLEAALPLVKAQSDDSTVVLGCSLTEEGVRRGLEDSYRALARATAGQERIKLVDRANRVRPRSLV
jgi:serine/threonine-protein kinase PknG